MPTDLSSPSDVPASVAVFSPTPLLTVTVEAAPDGRPELHVHAGGQGFWVARMVARLGVPVTLCAPFGGDTGRLIKVLVADEGVRAAGPDVAGANGSYVHDRRGGQRAEICSIPGEPLSRHEQDDLYGATFSAAMNARVLALTGQFPEPVVPPEMYRRLAHDLRANGRTVLADLSGEALCEALEGVPDAVCISHEQLIGDGFAKGEGVAELAAGVGALQRRGVGLVVLHRGAEPTLFRAGDRTAQVVTPRVDPLDHRGGGDTFFAALAVGMVRGRTIEDTVRFAAAAGTLNVTRRGLGTGRLEDIEALSRHVEIRPV